MSGYLLDTNILSELRKADKANKGVLQWYQNHVTDELWISVLVVAELSRGVELLRRRDEDAAMSLQTWLTGLTNDFSDFILPITLPVAQRWATLGIPNPIPVVDGLLAATALEHDLVLVTRNIKDISSTDVEAENPFV